MIPGRIENHTRALGAPAGWERDTRGHCGTLHIRDDKDAHGNDVMASVWLPTPEEIAAIVAGAPIILLVTGRGHPPVMLSVGEPAGA